jgi:hypothetical protein
MDGRVGLLRSQRERLFGVFYLCAEDVHSFVPKQL